MLNTLKHSPIWDAFLFVSKLVAVFMTSVIVTLCLLTLLGAVFVGTWQFLEYIQ